mgnify:CR=1 FL=1
MHDPTPASPAALMRRLRDQAFRASAADLEIEPTERHPRVWGAIVELGYPTGIATLLVLAEGTISLYFSNGGGVIGAGEDPAVQRTGAILLDGFEAHLEAIPRVEATPSPRIGRVRFYARTFDGTRGTEVPEEDLRSGADTLTPLYHAAHAVITAIRERET